jgi:hypothetical protein
VRPERRQQTLTRLTIKDSIDSNMLVSFCLCHDPAANGFLVAKIGVVRRGRWVPNAGTTRARTTLRPEKQIFMTTADEITRENRFCSEGRSNAGRQTVTPSIPIARQVAMPPEPAVHFGRKFATNNHARVSPRGSFHLNRRNTSDNSHTLSDGPSGRQISTGACPIHKVRSRATLCRRLSGCPPKIQTVWTSLEIVDTSGRLFWEQEGVL